MVSFFFAIPTYKLLSYNASTVKFYVNFFPINPDALP
jgi:hypothetical protein